MKIRYRVLKESTAREYLEGFYLSKSKIYLIFQDKRMTRGEEILSERTILHPGDEISVEEEGELDYAPVPENLDILYEDDYFLILNKPAGIIIHSDDKTKTDSLCSQVAGYYKKKNYDFQVLFAHRLDEETTGVIVFCKDILTHAYMNHYISTHEIRREYRALVQGTPDPKSGRISLSMGRDRHNAKKMRVSKEGMEAITNYDCLYSYKGYSLVKVILETGRTHQIRCHMSHIGNPLLGDVLYGGQKNRIGRVALHSYRIQFVHPVTGEPMDVTAEIPEDMKKLMR